MGFWNTPKYSRLDLLAIFMIASVLHVIVEAFI